MTVLLFATPVLMVMLVAAIRYARWHRTQACHPDADRLIAEAMARPIDPHAAAHPPYVITRFVDPVIDTGESYDLVERCQRMVWDYARERA